MTLSGTLGDLALADVVRLIAKSERTGVLRVSDGAIDGQVYFEAGELTYATSRSQDSLIGDLVRLGIMDEADRTRVERRKANLADVLRADTGREKLREFLEEQIVEVLVRLMRLSSGVFEFKDGVPARHITGQTFTVDVPLEESEARLVRWQDIEQVIPSPAHRLRMAPSLAEGESSVEVDAMSWSLLAALGDGATLSQITRDVGMWEYPAAKNLARLAREGLLEVLEPSQQPEARQQPREDRQEPVPEPADDDQDQPAAEPEDLEQPEDGPDPGDDDGSSDLMRRWKQLRSRDAG